jgi:hypothetical protein
MYLFTYTKNGLGYILGDLFTNASGNTGTYIGHAQGCRLKTGFEEAINEDRVSDSLLQRYFVEVLNAERQNVEIKILEFKM